MAPANQRKIIDKLIEAYKRGLRQQRLAPKCNLPFRRDQAYHWPRCIERIDALSAPVEEETRFVNQIKITINITIISGQGIVIDAQAATGTLRHLSAERLQRAIILATIVVAQREAI